MNQNYSNGIETAFSTSFTVPNYTNGGDKLKITIKFTAGANVTSAPRIEIDRVVLENNLGASRFSLVSYGSFDASSLNASGTATPLSSYWKTESNGSPTVVSGETLFGTSAKITGDINSKKYIKQRIYQILDSELDLYDYQRYDFCSNSGYEYIVSGFGLAANAVHSSYSTFRIRIDVIYYQGLNNADVTISHYFDFIPSCSGWQFTGGSFNTKYTKSSTDTNDYSCVKAIDVCCEYSNQPVGYALFDNNCKTEARERWGNTDAYCEHEQKTKNYTKEKWAEANDGLMAIFAELAACKASGASADSAETQALVAKLQAHITDNYYTCTDEILVGLGKMYVADERFKKNIDKYGDGTAEYVSDAIEVYSRV